MEEAGRITGVPPVQGALGLEISQLLDFPAIGTGETPHLSSHFFVSASEYNILVALSFD